MTTLRTAAQQALEALELTSEKRDPMRVAAITALRAALAQEQADSEPACKCSLRTRLVGDGCEVCNPQMAAELRQEKEQPAPEPEHKPHCALLQIPSRECDCEEEPDLSRCPQCGGPADNGHDRSIPPNPYLCTKCMAQPEPAPEPVAWAGYNLDGMVESFSRVIEAHYSGRHPFHNPLDMDARMALRILRGFVPAMKAYAAPPQQPEPVIDRTMATRIATQLGWVPPQRKPLTEEEIERICEEYQSPRQLARAIERAHGIKE